MFDGVTMDKASFRLGGGKGGHLLPLGTCEHYMRCDSKTSDAPMNLNNERR